MDILYIISYGYINMSSDFENTNKTIKCVVYTNKIPNISIENLHRLFGENISNFIQYKDGLGLHRPKSKIGPKYELQYNDEICFEM